METTYITAWTIEDVEYTLGVSEDVWDQLACIRQAEKELEVEFDGWRKLDEKPEHIDW